MTYLIVDEFKRSEGRKDLNTPRWMITTLLSEKPDGEIGELDELQDDSVSFEKWQ